MLHKCIIIAKSYYTTFSLHVNLSLLEEKDFRDFCAPLKYHIYMWPYKMPFILYMCMHNIHILHFCVHVCAHVCVYVYIHVWTQSYTHRRTHTLFSYGVHRFESRISLLNLSFSWIIIGALGDKFLLSNLLFEWWLFSCSFMKWMRSDQVNYEGGKHWH